MASKSTQVLERLKNTVAEGNYYEAQQLIKTLYFRYRTQNKANEARDILVNGATTMLASKQTTCASELAQILIGLYTEDHVKVTSDSLDTISKISGAFPPGDPGNISFLKASLKWSTAEGQQKGGDPILHGLLAQAYDEAGQYASAQKHYLRSNSASQFGRMLVEWASEGYQSERDLYIARAVFMYLSLANLRDANVIYQLFVKSYPTPTPLLNYLKFLLLTLERNAYPLFEILRKKYKPSLSRDPSFAQYLEHIAFVFYKVKPPSAGALGGLGGAGFGSLISDLFKNLIPSAPASSAHINSEDAD